MPDDQPTLVTADTLKQVGYTAVELQQYIFRQLGFPTWTVELTPQQVIDVIQDSLTMWNTWVPLMRIQVIQLSDSVYVYLDGQVMGQGVVDVQFVEPLPTPQAMFYGNLLTSTPALTTGIDDLDTFQRWRKTWMRVTSVRPDWYYDESIPRLYIHNPIQRYQCTVFYYDGAAVTESLPFTGAQWVKKYALEKARYLYGEVLSKFSGAIPGPMQSLTLDQAKRSNAEARLQKLEEQLQGMQRLTSLSVD